MPLAPGTRIGGYEIAALVGAGGMGEVYRARDARLNRDVALKVLPPQTAGSPQALARFEREAQAVAALSHPNILAVHDFGTADGIAYAVFELLEGATLRERLATGPLQVRKAIDFARQTADGLAAAHSRGIAHRDIKPDNLFVTDDGRVKILDFGLALTAAELGAHDQSVTQAPITGAGTILGTVGYMAPEQVRGQTADGRADLFALGAVLYEMCTGQRAFKGATPADTMSAVLSSEPPDLVLSGQPTPPALERIIRRCLEKQPGERFQSARDLSFALDALSTLSGPASDAPSVVLTPARRWTVPVAAAAMALVAGALIGRAIWPVTRPAAPALEAPAIRAEFNAFSGGTAVSHLMAMSPDGRHLAYADNLGSTGRRALIVRTLATGEVQPVPGGDGGFAVSWSPRSDELLYFAGRELRRFRLGEKTAAAIYSTTDNFRGAVWLSDDTVVLAAGGIGTLRRMPVTGGPGLPVTAGDGLFRAPSAIGARSDYVLVTMTQGGSATNRQVVAVRLADGQITPLVANDAAALFVPGYLLLPRSTGVYAVPFDETAMKVTGEPVRVGEPVIWDPPTGNSSLVVSQAGVVAYRPGRDRALQFEWLDKAGASLGLVGPPAFYGSFALSPDGTRIVARQINQVGSRTGLNLFLIDDARKIAAPMTTPSGAISDPIWSADGTRIYYRLDGTLVRQAPAGGTQEVVAKELLYPDHASPDGRWIIVGSQQPGTGFGLEVLPVDGAGARQVIAREPNTSVDEGSFSPDGRLIAYQSTRTGRSEIYVARFPLTDDRWQISSNGGLQARWADDGRTLYFIDLDGRLDRVAISSAAPDKAGPAEPMFDLGIGPPSLLLEQYAVHGSRFLVLRPAKNSAPQTIAVVANWRSLLPKPATPGS